MIKPKNIAIPAVCGFAVSFLISLIATHRFGFSLLRGAIFAVVFGLIAVGITFLYDKFLSDEGDSEVSSSPEKNKSGSIVDITINDETLPDDGQGPQFFVSNNKKPLETDDKSVAGDFENKSNANAQENKSPELEKDNSSAFKAVPLGQPFKAENTEASEVKKASEESAEPKVAEADEEPLEGLDSLPDIGNIVSEEKKETSDDDLIKDSDFAESGQTESSHKAEFPDGSKAASHDTETMAKAIRTLLKKDE